MLWEKRYLIKKGALKVLFQGAFYCLVVDNGYLRMFIFKWENKGWDRLSVCLKLKVTAMLIDNEDALYL